MKSIDDLQADIEKQITQSKDNLEPDSFTNWQHHPVTKLFLDDIKWLMLDRMASITKTQPINDEQRALQAMDRGFVQCLDVILQWNPVEEAE